MAWKRAILSGGRKVPPRTANFSAFHSAGLWLAVTAIPPAASASRTASISVGVGTMPSSTTSHPAERRPATTARCSIGPEVLESRPTTTFPRSPSSLRNVPYAAPRPVTSSGVRGAPTTPRKPDTLTMRSEGSWIGMRYSWSMGKARRSAAGSEA